MSARGGDARTRPRTSREDASQYEAVVVPRYSRIFSEMLLPEIATGSRVTVLDVGCGPGHPTIDILRRIGEGGRVIGIDVDAGMIDIARQRGFEQTGKRLFFKVEPAEGLSFGDQVFDHVVGNLALPHLREPERALAEMRRVLAPSGTLLLTCPLSGSFVEVHDMLRELAERRDDAGLAQRLADRERGYPTRSALSATVRAAGFAETSVRKETHRISFRNAAELFSDPLVRMACVPDWHAVCGGDDALLKEAERSLTTYFGGGPVSLTVEAGLIVALKG